MNPADSADVELDTLTGLFFDDQSLLGKFQMVRAAEVPPPSQQLLAHDSHMTVTVEKHHGCEVNVKVLETRVDGDWYSRKILLTRSTDEGVVQYGIVRLDLSVLAPDVRSEIVGQGIPLGRVLINHNVMRRVKLLGLFKIESGSELADYFHFEPGDVCYGRTALIYLDGSPAIELLEIVS